MDINFEAINSIFKNGFQTTSTKVQLAKLKQTEAQLRFYYGEISLKQGLAYPVNKNCPSRGIRFYWRRLRDSNPRYTCAYTNFPGLLVRPL